MRRLLLIATTVATAFSIHAQNWSGWKPDAVFPGIETRERCAGFNEFANQYLWDVQLRNQYSKVVDVIWAAEPERLRGAEAQIDHAMGIRPGEVVSAQHTLPKDCATRLSVKVTDVRNGTAATSSMPPARENPHAAPPARPMFEGRWQSKDPEPFRKQFDVQFFGDTVTSRFSSPKFSFQVTTPVPTGLSGGISVDHDKQ